MDTDKTSVYNAFVAELKLLFPHEEIEARVRQLGAEITADYRGADPLIIGVLKGAVIFLADLIRQIDLPLEIDFIGLSSYGDGTSSCGEAIVTACPAVSLKGRHVLLVEDIIDTGYCLETLLKIIKAGEPASVKLCALLDKPGRRQVPVSADYSGFNVPDAFVVGYGLDCGQRYRNLPDIYTLGESESG